MAPAVCLIATGYVNCNASLAVFLIIAAVGFSGISLAGFMVNHLDLAPLYAGLYFLAFTGKFVKYFEPSCLFGSAKFDFFVF